MTLITASTILLYLLFGGGLYAMFNPIKANQKKDLDNSKFEEILNINDEEEDELLKSPSKTQDLIDISEE